MRDIRSDLQERARLFEHEITTVNSRFQNTIEQLQKERDKRVAELNAELPRFAFSSKAKRCA